MELKVTQFFLLYFLLVYIVNPQWNWKPTFIVGAEGSDLELIHNGIERRTQYTPSLRFVMWLIHNGIESYPLHYPLLSFFVGLLIHNGIERTLLPLSTPHIQIRLLIHNGIESFFRS